MTMNNRIRRYDKCTTRLPLLLLHLHIIVQFHSLSLYSNELTLYCCTHHRSRWCQMYLYQSIRDRARCKLSRIADRPRHRIYPCVLLLDNATPCSHSSSTSTARSLSTPCHRWGRPRAWSEDRAVTGSSRWRFLRCRIPNRSGWLEGGNWKMVMKIKSRALTLLVTSAFNVNPIFY